MARTDELARLKGFCERVVAVLLPADDAGAALRNEMTSAISGCKTLQGARMLVRDLLEWSQDLHGTQLTELESALASAGLPTLTLMRSKENAELADILKRGVVANEDECRLLVSSLADTETTLRPADQALADRLLQQYRNKHRRGGA